nr:deaminase domain-containing protein [Luteibacter anthropi]
MSSTAAELAYGATQLAPIAVEATLSNKAVNAEAAANAAARGTYITFDRLSKEITDVRSGLASKFKNSGNMAAAEIDIPGLPGKMAAHSRIEKPTDAQVELGIVGYSSEFKTFSVENATGDLINRNGDTEASILGNIAERLGSNRSATGSITLLTERSVCESCAGVISKFRERYPGITLNVVDNDGVLLRPRSK